jgi:hypothetical protein
VPHSRRQGFPGAEKILTAEGAENAEKNDSKSRIVDKEKDLVKSRHSGQAQRDPESRIFKRVWIPAFAGMTA